MLEITWTCTYGKIKYYRGELMVAECGRPDHKPDRCRLTRSARNIGVLPLCDRPLALLYSWMKYCPEELSSSDHVHLWFPQDADTLTAIGELNELATKSVAEARMQTSLFGKERGSVRDEGDEPARASL